MFTNELKVVHLNIDFVLLTLTIYHFNYTEETERENYNQYQNTPSKRFSSYTRKTHIKEEGEKLGS